MSRDLDDILADNLLDRTMAKRREIEARYAPRLAALDDFKETMDARFAKITEAERDHLNDMEIGDEQSMRQAADYLGLDQDAFIEYHQTTAQILADRFDEIDYQGLLDEGNKLLYGSLTGVTLDNYTTIKRPALIFGTTDWCQPCTVVKSTFVELAAHLDVDVYFTKDEELMRAEFENNQGRFGQGFYVPQMLLVTDEGKVASDLQADAKKLWESMQGIVSLGKSYVGRGQFRCDEDGVCTIEEK